jgi:hypothetical protein
MLIHLISFGMTPIYSKSVLKVYSTAASCYARPARFLSVVTPHGGHYEVV